MHDTSGSPEITLRIPGDWAHPRELVERLPDGFRLPPEALFLPHETMIEFIPMPPDDHFPRIFESSCRRPPTADELAVVRRYTVNVGLTGPGGSMESAVAMMQAGAAIVRAGGAGVFNDNSGLAHGGGDCIGLTEDAGPDAISFAFTSVVRGSREVYTMGMQVMGFPDLLMRSADVDDEGETISQCHLSKTRQKRAQGGYGRESARGRSGENGKWTSAGSFQPSVLGGQLSATVHGRRATHRATKRPNHDSPGTS